MTIMHMNALAILKGFCITQRQRLHRECLFGRFAISGIALVAACSPAFAAETMGGAVINGSSVYGAAELFQVYRDHLGNIVTEQTAKNIAETLQQRYLDDGYSRPGYRIVDRGIDSGIVRIRIVEPSISGVAINGDAGPYREKLEHLVAHLPSDRSLRPQEIREMLRDARRLPGLEIDVAAEPDGQNQGGFVLAVDSAYKPIEGSVRISNRGTREIGRDILFARVMANSLFGREMTGGLFGTSAKDSDDYRGGGFFVTFMPGSGGTSIQMQGAVTTLSYETQGIDVEQDRTRYTLKLMHPLLRQANRDLSVWGGVVIEDLDVSLNGLQSREERLRSIEAGSNFTWQNQDTHSLLSLELEQGVNGLGSRLDSAATTADPRNTDFSIARLRYARLAPINDLWSWRVDAYAQTSPDVLPSIKRFKVGGGRIGRGFEAAAVSSDSGIGGKVELKRQVGEKIAWLERGDLYGFYDLGSAWRNDAGGRESASSTAIGASLHEGRLSGSIEIARPLTHADADGRKDVGIFAELSFRF
jgi:hemolysin activation/secretion protein